MFVEVSNNMRITISELSKNELSKIKDSLTYENPKYKQAKRYGKSKYISIPKYLTYYTEKEGILNIPLGVDLSELVNEKLEYRSVFLDGCVKFPSFQLVLRNTQNVAFHTFVESNKKNQQKGVATGIIQMPTAKGKTVLGLYLAGYYKKKTLILVHKEDLVVGWTKDIKKCFGDIDIGLIKAKSRTVGSQFTIATIQTLSRMDTKELSKYTRCFGTIIQDECHHVGASTFNIIDKFIAPVKIGLSATPTRTDGLTHVFDLYFGGIVYKHPIQENDEDICNVDVIVKKSMAKYKPFILLNNNRLISDQFFNYYDFSKETLPRDYQFLEDIPFEKRPSVPFLSIDDNVVRNRKYKIQVCSDILNEVLHGHSCLALFTQKEHINLYYDYLKRYIPKARIMKYYGDSKEKSEVLIEKADSKEVLVTLGTLAKTTEGTNVKSWEVLFLVSSINNEKNVEQAIGRIRRTKDGKINPVRVYDYVHSDVYSQRNHFTTRKMVYNRLKLTVTGDITKDKGLFSKGY